MALVVQLIRVDDNQIKIERCLFFGVFYYSSSSLKVPRITPTTSAFPNPHFPFSYFSNFITALVKSVFPIIRPWKTSTSKSALLELFDPLSLPTPFLSATHACGLRTPNLHILHTLFVLISQSKRERERERGRCKYPI